MNPNRPNTARGARPEVVRYRPPRPDALGVETLSLAQLRQRGTAAHLARLQRLEFLMFVLYTSGRGKHVVDFVSHRVAPGTLVVVQPGNLHRFCLNDSMDARLLLVETRFMLPERLAWLKPLLSGRPWPVCSSLPQPTCVELLDICRHLEADIDRRAAPRLSEALARQRLYTWLLILRMAWDAGDSRAEEPPRAFSLVNEFQALLERHYAERWTVKDYARKLGYAERTISRACLWHSGRSAKALIDARVLLEAKRLLAHGDDSVEAISHFLGFGDASPLVQFFKRLEGVTPQAFRVSFRGRG
ncbi:MAG: helix-turn-helix transcriptional regulator [Burkholderiales bacterium]